LGVYGWNVEQAYFEGSQGQRVWPVGDYLLPSYVILVLRLRRRFARGRCPRCGRVCNKSHGTVKTRRWQDLPWAGHRVVVEYTPQRVVCKRCGATPVEALPWAEPYQRETRRLQQHLALQAASMPTIRVAAQFGLSWATVRRAEEMAIARWEAQRRAVELRDVGVDEKYLGRRHKRGEKYVTIVSNLETGEPVSLAYGRDEKAFKQQLDRLTDEQKARIRLFAMDMHEPFKNAVRNDPLLADIPIVHDPFHVTKRANQAVEELRRAVFFRAGEQMRALGRGKRWLFLRAWERCNETQQADLKALLARNSKLAAAYQIKEELRGVLRAPDEHAMAQGMARILRRTQRKSNVELRKLHDSLRNHLPEILALGKYRPPVGRIEALNNNWETLVRVARGYRNHQYLLRKLRFLTVNPIQTADGVRDFLALADPDPELVKVALGWAF
jgi:transposase